MEAEKRKSDPQRICKGRYTLCHWAAGPCTNVQQAREGTRYSSLLSFQTAVLPSQPLGGWGIGNDVKGLEALVGSVLNSFLQNQLIQL